MSHDTGLNLKKSMILRTISALLEREMEHICLIGHIISYQS